MKTLACLIALTSVMAGTAFAQNTQNAPNANPQSDSSQLPQGRGAGTIPGNRDPGAESVVVPRDNPGSTSVDRSAVGAPTTSNPTSDRTTSREWQGLGSTGGATGTGTSSGTIADEVAPGQDGNRPDNAGTSNSQDTSTAAPEKQPTAPARE